MADKPSKQQLNKTIIVSAAGRSMSISPINAIAATATANETAMKNEFKRLARDVDLVNPMQLAGVIQKLAEIQNTAIICNEILVKGVHYELELL